MTEPAGPAALVLVATPIGNWGDISARALDELERADSVACEDSRRTGALFAHFGLGHDPFIVCNDHTEVHAAEEIVRRIQSGQRVVLVSDAGTPAISDPGYRAVRAAIDAGVSVEVVPGPSAVLAAVSLSGFATDRFCFEGFLPRKGGDRSRRLQTIAEESRTTVIFESPRRLEAALADLAEACGDDRKIAIARELTKTYEEIWRGTIADGIEWLGERPAKGEIVVVIDGAPEREVADVDLTALLEVELQGGASTRDAVASVVDRTGASKRRVYDLANELRHERP